MMKNINIVSFGKKYNRDLNYINEHLCFVIEYNIYNQFKQLTNKFYTLSIAADVYKCTNRILNEVEKNPYILTHEYIIKLPIQIDNFSLYISKSIFDTYESKEYFVGLMNEYVLYTFRYFDINYPEFQFNNRTIFLTPENVELIKKELLTLNTIVSAQRLLLELDNRMSYKV